MPRIRPLTEEARVKESFNYVFDKKRAENKYKDWAAVAKALGVVPETLYSWKRKPSGIPQHRLREIYRLLKYTPDDIYQSFGFQKTAK